MTSTSLFLLLSITNFVLSASQIIWTQYNNYSCDVSSAFTAAYDLTVSECFNLCLTNYSSRCKGIMYYEYAKLDVTNDPTRCYLLHKYSELNYLTSLPVMTAYWSPNISNQFLCRHYPPNVANNSAADTCEYWEENECKYSDFEPKSFSWSSYYDVCCSCNASLFEYNEYLFEPLWNPGRDQLFWNKPDRICQTYTAENLIIFNITQIIPKWPINKYISVCQYFQQKLLYKSTIYRDDCCYQSLSDKYQSDQYHYDLLANFNCINALSTWSVYICHGFNHNVYPFIVDLESNQIYLNADFIDYVDLQNNVINDNISVIHSECSISSMVSDKTIESDIFTPLICPQAHALCGDLTWCYELFVYGGDYEVYQLFIERNASDINNKNLTDKLLTYRIDIIIMEDAFCRDPKFTFLYSDNTSVNVIIDDSHSIGGEETNQCEPSNVECGELQICFDRYDPYPEYGLTLEPGPYQYYRVTLYTRTGYSTCLDSNLKLLLHCGDIQYCVHNILFGLIVLFIMFF